MDDNFIEVLCQKMGIPKRVFEGTTSPESTSAEYEKWAMAREVRFRELMQKSMEEYWRGVWPGLIHSVTVTDDPVDSKPDVIVDPE